MKKQNGITLISLIVTIIVILILSGVSINFILGEDSVIGNALTSKEQQKIFEITNSLELEKSSIRLSKLNLGLSIDEYLTNVVNDLSDKYSIEEETDTPESPKIRYITVDNTYRYMLEEKDDGDIEITYKGKK